MERVTKIKKVRVKESHAEIEYDIVGTNESGDPQVDTINYKGGAKPHPDFLMAINTLRIHALLMTDQVTMVALEESTVLIDDTPEVLPVRIPQNHVERLQKTKVTGYTIGGDEDQEGVVIIAQRKIPNNKTLNLITPFYKFDEEEYPINSELGICIMACEEEAKLYLNGKHAPSPQMEMEFGDKREE